MTHPLHILAISGSLRAASSNTAVLEALAALAPADVTITLYDQLADLPYFNPDLDREGDTPPVSVADLRTHGLLVNYKQTVLRAVQEVDTAMSAYAGQQDRLRNLGEALSASQRAVSRPVCVAVPPANAVAVPSSISYPRPRFLGCYRNILTYTLMYYTLMPRHRQP